METKDSEYYMGNNEVLPTILQLKTQYGVMTYELPWDADAECVINAMYSAMIGMTFPADGVLEAMKQFVKDHTEKIDESSYE